jgi:SAM-dependent methyltransferase
VDWRSWLDGAKAGGLGYFEAPFLSHLPKEGKILEAGCGIGQMVVALKARGYDVEGVEFSAKTVAMVKGYLPDCPVRVGDVRGLDYPDGHFAGYISLGVVEHFREGPSEILAEAARVLKPGGTMLISVPRFNPLRRMKASLGLYSSSSSGEFYQYAFQGRELSLLLKKARLIPRAIYFYDVIKGLKDEIPVFRYFLKRGVISPSIQSRMNSNRTLLRACSHMILFVAQKGAGEES